MSIKTILIKGKLLIKRALRGWGFELKSQLAVTLLENLVFLLDRSKKKTTAFYICIAFSTTNISKSRCIKVNFNISSFVQ